jgi:hypothetical protein
MDALSPLFSLPLLVPGQFQKDITHNEALLLIDAILAAELASRTLAAPPAAPRDGAMWLVPSPATGEWAGKSGMLALATAGGWRFVAVPAGATFRVRDEKLRTSRTESGWQDHAEAPHRSFAVAAPEGGAVIDREARVAIAQLAAGLRAIGFIV